VFSSCFALRKKTESQAHLTDTPRKAPTKKTTRKHATENPSTAPSNLEVKKSNKQERTGNIMLVRRNERARLFGHNQERQNSPYFR
jgi:hypothetical protein